MTKSVDASPQPHAEVIVIGAGPVGLCAATALARAGLTVVVIEKQRAEALVSPGHDGREIALTHRSRRLMSELGLWAALPADEIAPLRAAQVMNGDSRHSLQFDPQDAGVEVLGYLVSNHHIRRAAYQCMTQQSGVTLLSDCEPAKVMTAESGVFVQLDNGHTLQARLLIAADSRYSPTRRSLGIPADMIDFGKTMLVCRMTHECDHQQTALEWFGQDQTLALLPMNGNQSSVVITVPAVRAQQLQELPVDAFNREVERMFTGRLGRMRLQGERHAYPLVATWARQFVATRTALLGDAAVGMHPVTAHGFNLGLRGQHTLVQSITAALRAGRDIGSEQVLREYAQRHRRDTLPLYAATNAIVRLYTDNRPLARISRQLALRMANRLSPFKQRLVLMLAER